MDTGTRKFAAIVVVILLVLGGLVGALLYVWEPGTSGPHDNEEGWIEENMGYLVNADSTWSGWDIQLDKPVYVGWGVDLRIVDSRIVVPLERLALGLYEFRNAFTVEDEGSLTIARSEIVIESDPHLEDAWVTRAGNYDGIPYFWRAVDLREASLPTLELDVKLINGSSTLAVAVQVSPDDELRLLKAFDDDDIGSGEWVHLEVPLDDLVGTTPRLVVFVHDAVDRSMLVSGVRVMDGDGPLEADPFRTGGLWDENWYVENFDAFDYYDADLHELIMSDGAVRLEEAVISSVPGLERYSTQYTPHREADTFRFRSMTVPSASMGAGINVSDGQLTIRDSNLSYVPCIALDSIVDVRGSGFVGDDEMLTLFDCTGSVKGCRFKFDPGNTDRASRSWDEILWQLALEERTIGTLVSVDGCSFVGMGSGEGDGFGLHVSGVGQMATNCTFENLELAYWVHGDILGKSWETINGTMSFGDDCAYWYLDSRETRLNMEGPGRSSYGSYITLEEVELLEGPEVPFKLKALTSRYRMDLIVPASLARPGTGVITVEELTIVVGPIWSDQRFVSFDPTLSVVGIWFDDRVDDITFADIWPSFRQGSSVGHVLVNLTSFVWDPEFDDYEIGLDMDGEPFRYENVSIDARPFGTFVNMTTEVAIPTGVHELSFRLIAKYLRTQSRVVVGVHTLTVARLSETMAGWDANELLANDSALLILDPGVEQEGLKLRFVIEDMVFYLFDVIVWEDSRLVLEELVGWKYIDVYLVASGPGEVVVRDVRLQSFTAIFNRTRAVLDGVMDVDQEIELRGINADIQMMGRVRTRELVITQTEGSGLDMDGCDVAVEDDVEIWSVNSTVHIVDSVFSRWSLNDYLCEVFIMVAGHSVLDLERCTFDEVPLKLRIWDVNTTLRVEGCNFIGPRAFLFLLGIQYSGESYQSIILPADGEISGNMFSGEGAGLVFDPMAREGLLGPNEFAGGALALAYYTPEVTYVHGSSGYPFYNATTRGGAAFLDIEGFSDNQDWRTDWYQYLVDVTEDPLEDVDPGLVPVTVMDKDSGSGGNWYGVVIMFTRIPVNGGEVTIRVTMWPPIYNELRVLASNIHSGTNWWSEGQQ